MELIRDVRTSIFCKTDSLNIEPSRQRFKIFAILRILPRRRNCEDIYTKFDERLIEVLIDEIELFPLELSGWSKVTFRSRGQFAHIKPGRNLFLFRTSGVLNSYFYEYFYSNSFFINLREFFWFWNSDDLFWTWSTVTFRMTWAVQCRLNWTNLIRLTYLQGVPSFCFLKYLVNSLKHNYQWYNIMHCTLFRHYIPYILLGWVELPYRRYFPWTLLFL